MAESIMGSCPQVFVVDSQANYYPSPSARKSRWVQDGQRFLLLLVGLAVLGLAVEGFFIYKLYIKTEEFSRCNSNPLCQNQSTPWTSAQEGGTMKNRAGPEGSGEILSRYPHLGQIQKRPFAHLLGSNDAAQGEKNVVQWVSTDGEAITYNMGYNNGRLLIEREGYYYLYSKVQLNAEKECSLILHKVMKDSRAYGLPIELMKSKSSRCDKASGATASGATASEGEYLWDSFLAGIFHLQYGDQIFVMLEDMDKMRTGPTENFMGAFMVSP